MFAVVLVGGFGTRLRPLTNDVPKPMLPVLHRPMIVWLVERLAEAGVTDVVLALGFKPEPFQSAFPGAGHGDVRIHYAVEPEPLDTGGAIRFAARAVDVGETFIVANGDIITDLPFEELVASHRSSGAQATLHLTSVEDPSAFGVVEVDRHGLVRRFVEKPAPGESDSNLINAGTYVLEPEILDLIAPTQPVSVERSIFPHLAERGVLHGLPTTHYWLDAGRPDQYLQANLDVIRGLRGRGANGVHVAARVDDGALVVESVVGPSVTVADGAIVTESVLLPGAKVGPRAVVERSVVAGVVSPGAVVKNSVIGSDQTIGPGRRVVDELLPTPD